MAILAFDQAKRRRRLVPGSKGPAKILRLDRLTDGVLLRVIARAARQELANLQYIYQLTKGEPDILPTREQMEEMENGTIEF